MYDTLSFGLWLRERRKALGLTQEDLAEHLSCSGSLVRKLEAGQRVASPEMAEQLAELAQVPSEERAAFVQFAYGRLSGEAASRRLWQTLHTLTARPHSTNLAAPLTALIGREHELRSLVQHLLSGVERLVTITGPPGIGKTRLAIETGIRLLDHFEDGVYFVSLAALTDPGLVPSAVAQAVGVRETGTLSVDEHLRQFLREKQMLLVLDNFEQVLDAAPSVVNILEACPRVKGLVTSREALHTRGEHVFPVPPLKLPSVTGAQSLEALMESPAVALFVERARAIDPAFSLTEQNAEAVASICVGLEGMPLAIELAAARVRMLAPREIQERLGERLKLLSKGPRDLPARQRTLRSTIDWSYALLSEGEQKLFARLGVFARSFTLSAAEAICNARCDLPFETLEGVESLLDKNLLKRMEMANGEPRFGMLETIREYSREKLRLSGESGAVQREHALHFMHLAEEAEPHLTGAGQKDWLSKLEDEHDNLRAALRWAHEGGHDERRDDRERAEIALRTAGAIWRFWDVRGYYSEGREWLEGLLGVKQAGGTPEDSAGRAHEVEAEQGDLRVFKVKVLEGAGTLANRHAHHSIARRFNEDCLALMRELGDKAGVASALNNLGIVASEQGDLDYARSFFEESLALRRELGDKSGIAAALNNLGNVAQEQGDYTYARAMQAESLALRREIGHKWAVFSLSGLGEVLVAASASAGDKEGVERGEGCWERCQR